MALNHNPYETAQRTLSGITAFASPDFNVNLLNNDQYLETKTGDKRKPVVYGTTRLGGILVFQDLIGENKDYLLQVYTLCEGEITGIPAIFANGTDTSSSLYDATLQQIDGKKVKVSSWPVLRSTVYTQAYQDLFNVLGTVSNNKQRVIYTQVSTGRTDYTSTPLTIAKLSPKWDDTFLGNASASVAVVYDLSAFSEEPKLEFMVKGIKVRNLKTGVQEVSSNPAYCLYDYLTNERYGNNTDPSILDIQSFINQAEICDQPIDIKTGVNLLSNTSAKTTIQKSSSSAGGTVINIGPSRFQKRGRVNYYRGQIVNDGFDVVNLKATNSSAENTKTAIPFNKQIINDPAFHIKDPILLINTLSYNSGGWNSGGDYYNYAIIINAKGEYIAVIAYDGSDVDVTVELEVQNKPAGNTVSEKRFSINGIINQEETKDKNVDNILAEMNARIYDYNGKKHLKCFVPNVVVKTFDDTNIIGTIDYAFGDSETKYNGVQATYRDPNFGYKDQTVVTVDNTYNGGNSNSKNFKELKLNFCDSYGRAHYLASMFLNKSKLQDSIKFTSTRAGIVYAVGDVIRVNDRKNNINRTYTIEDKTINKDFTVTFNCLIYDSEIFKVLQLDIPYEPMLPVTPSKTINIDSFNVKQVAFDSVGTADLIWSSSVGSGLVDHYTLEYKASRDNGVGFSHLATLTSGNSYRVNNLKSGDYVFRVRALNKLETIASDWAVAELNVNTNIVTLPAVTQLQANFNGASFEASWKDTRTVALNTDNNPSSVGETYARYISGYQVQVFKGSTLRRTEIVQDPRYVYSLEKNIQDGISRDIKITVKTVNQSNTVSTTSASVQAVNSQCPAPVNLLINVNYDTFYLSTFKPLESDYAGTVVHASKTENFTPSASTLISNGPNTASGTLATGTWFFKVAHYDVFDSLTLNFASATAVLTEVTLADIDVDDIITGIEKGLETEALTRAKEDLKNAQATLDAVAKEASHRVAAITAEAIARNNALAKEASDRAAAITAEATVRHNALLLEASERGTAIKNESTERKTAEANLATRIDSVVAANNANGVSITNEITARTAADTALGKRVDSVVSTSNANQASIASLSKTVTDNNSAMSTKVDTVQATAAQQATAAENNAKAFATASVTTEKNARIAAGSALTTQFNSVKSTADKNTADITTVNTALVTKETALSNRIDAVQSSVNGVDGKVQTEITTRSAADTALGKRIDTVSATANKNTADITTVNTVLAEKDLAMSSRFTQMETSLKADSASKAATAEANAKLAAATDAKAKADAALTAAKTDATGKANAAESNAKIAAATDAAAKANKALADAKAYSDANDVKATNYTNAKYSDAVNLINTKDAAQASRVTQMESALKADSQNKVNAVIADLNSRSNLLQKYLPNWKLGAHPAECSMGLNGAAIENRFVMGDDPFGTKSVLWEMSTDSNNNSDADGGIGAGWFDCDSKKSYRFSIYVNRSVLNGTTYLGAGQGGETLELNGTPNLNPYFWAGMLPQANKWYLIVGVLQAESGTAQSGFSGLWDCETGQRVLSGTDFKIKAGITRQYLRAYLYYSNNTNAKQYFWAPRVDVIDGNEPSLTSMMPMIAVNALLNANAAQAYATAKYNEVVNTITTKDNAQTSRVTSMEASLKTDATNKANTAETNAKNAATTYTNTKYTDAVNLVNSKDSAMSTRVNSLSTTLNNTTASVNSLATSVNGLTAEYTIKVNASGHVSGIGLSSGPMGSAFIAQADRIVLANSAGGGSVTPFKMVSNVVYLNEAVIQNASITAAKIANANITNAHIANGAITNAKIADATISFAKIANDIRSTNYVAGVSGWQLTKEGALNAINANISGTINSSKISGSFLEGTVVFGASGFLTATTADNGIGIRYGGQESYYVTRSARSIATDPTMTFRIASYNFIGDGYDTINTNPPTQIARDYKRCISNNFSGLGWIDVEAAGVGNLNMNTGTSNTIKIWMEVVTYDHQLVRKTLPNITLYDGAITHGSIPKALSVQRVGCIGQLYYEPAVVNGRNTIKTLYLTIDKLYSQPYSLQKYFTLTIKCTVNGIDVPYSSTITVRADDFQFYSS
ncbi:DUF1983 domain-containing protein [Shewanella sp. MM_2022_3]|uniref:phage tail tip fiber protein n=1 Tax=Shewanella sp. MM_2022_3 TaxID=2923280 RepID=UPI001F4BDDE1|nr:DUF1983 domain-containing protein [Shewanella sp. MM_2022_3]MCH7424985.1 DUF1983 domain-containing protein [Shewanella sp. MM_2022_3]